MTDQRVNHALGYEMASYRVREENARDPTRNAGQVSEEFVHLKIPVTPDLFSCQFVSVAL